MEMTRKIVAAFSEDQTCRLTGISVGQFQRDQSLVGQIRRSRFINHNAPVVAGTRIPVRAIKRFAAAGYSHEQIIKEYPDLKEDDVKAALAYDMFAAV